MLAVLKAHPTLIPQGSALPSIPKRNQAGCMLSIRSRDLGGDVEINLKKKK